MELLCPSCQTRLNIPDEFAGQTLKCTQCSNLFQAPALPTFSAPPPPPPPIIPPAPPPTPEPPPTPGPAAFKLMDVPSPESAPPKPETPPVEPTVAAGASPPPGAAPSPETPPQEAKPGEYTRIYTINFKRSFITWIAPGGIALLFLLTFFPWSFNAASVRQAQNLTNNANKDSQTASATPPAFNPRSANPWVLAFSNRMMSFLLYIFFFFLTAVASILTVLLDKKIISLPEQIKKVRPYRALIVAGLATLSFLFIFFYWVGANFETFNPTTIWFKIAIRVHFLVIVGALLDYWLQRRRKQELPEPKLEFRW